MPRPPPKRLSRVPDGRLPVYTVIAALYREAKSVAQLMQAINALDYPREKLQVILAIEPNDLATRAAIARLRSDAASAGADRARTSARRPSRKR